MLNKSNFLIAKLASNEDEDVPVLWKGILVSPKGTAVTDGHLAVSVSAVEADQQSLLFELDGLEPAEYWTNFMLDKDSALKIATSISAKAEAGQAFFGLVDATTEDNPKAMVAVNKVNRQAIVRSNKLDCQFPDLAKLTPDKEHARFTLQLNPQYLLSLLKVVAQFCKSHKLGSIELRAYSGRKPLRIDAVAENQELLELIMPQREAEESDSPAIPVEPTADPTPLVAKLSDIKKLSDEDRVTLRKWILGGTKREARYPDVPEVREILAKLTKTENGEL